MPTNVSAKLASKDQAAALPPHLPARAPRQLFSWAAKVAVAEMAHFRSGYSGIQSSFESKWLCVKRPDIACIFALRKGPKLGPQHSKSGASLGACLTPHSNTLLDRVVCISYIQQRHR